MYRLLTAIVCLSVLALLTVGCEKPGKTEAAKDLIEPAPSEIEAEHVQDHRHGDGPLEHSHDDEAVSSKLSGAHILIAYKGAKRAGESVTRSKQEAQELADRLARQVSSEPSRFAEFAKSYSDCPSGPRGGDMGIWIKGSMVPEFEKALLELKDDGITPVSVESDFGFHVIMRLPKTPIVEVSAEHIVLVHKDSVDGPVKHSRSRAEALELAKKAAKEAKADPSRFESIAQKYSDEKTTGLPVWSTGKGTMQRVFDETVLNMKIGEVSDPVETQFGYHVMHRLALPQMLAAYHILVAYENSKSGVQNITRSKEEANKRAQEVYKKIKADPERFLDYVSEYSDDPGVAANKGNLGAWRQTMMIRDLEILLTGIDIGEVAIGESPLGFHVVRRMDPETIEPAPQMMQPGMEMQMPPVQ